ncbi:DUF6985 domain-containing protein [Kitasatospora sp. NPDC048365]|uniref:DUF6985 domain-containing protein n=1 Tax=Kitasatospora sp. NPDC048365 TaxID=3364050 RepID=UPI0037100308
MEIPGLGPVTLDPDYEGYRSEPTPVPVLGGLPLALVAVGYDGDDAPEDFHAAAAAFLALDAAVLRAAAPPIFAYYLDTRAELGQYGDLVEIAGPQDVLAHVRPGGYATLERDDDGPVYVSVECECAWEVEHGLQLVFRGGRAVTKVGPFDGQLTTWREGDPDGLPEAVYRR